MGLVTVKLSDLHAAYQHGAKLRAKETREVGIKGLQSFTPRTIEVGSKAERSICPGG